MSASDTSGAADPSAAGEQSRGTRLEYTPEERYLFQNMTGFFRSKVLAIASKADLFTWISRRPRTPAQLQEKMGFAGRPARMFVEALVAMGLVRLEDGKLRNSPVAAKYLVKGRLSYQGPTIELFDALYESCADLHEVLRTGEPNNRSYTYFFSEERPEKTVDEYSTHMHETAIGPVMVLHEFVDFSRSRRLLDVGGGLGRTCMTLVSQYPQLEAHLFDLPEVCRRAEAKLSGFYLAHRVHLHPGDFFRDPFPGSMDTVLMMRITHDWFRDQVRLLFERAFDALVSGGRLLVYETLKEDDSKAPGDATLVSLLLLLISPGGECRTPGEMRALLQEIGFVDVEVIPTIYIYSAVVARKP